MLQSMGLQTVKHDRVTEQETYTGMHFLRLTYSMVKFMESKSTLVDARGKMGASKC